MKFIISVITVIVTIYGEGFYVVFLTTKVN